MIGHSRMRITLNELKLLVRRELVLLNEGLEWLHPAGGIRIVARGGDSYIKKLGIAKINTILTKLKEIKPTPVGEYLVMGRGPGKNPFVGARPGVDGDPRYFKLIQPVVDELAKKKGYKALTNALVAWSIIYES